MIRFPPYGIGELAQAAGVTPETLRYYERLGLLSASRSRVRGHRRYGPEALHRLQFIRRALVLGFTLVDVKELLELASGEGRGIERVRELAQSRLDDVEARLADLGRLRAALQALVASCPGRGNSADCPILAALGGGKGGDVVDRHGGDSSPRTPGASPTAIATRRRGGSRRRSAGRMRDRGPRFTSPDQEEGIEP